jgi:hypothetical protein
MPKAEYFSSDGSLMQDYIANTFPQGSSVKYRRGLIFFHDSPLLYWSQDILAAPNEDETDVTLGA